jgi:hypothetical protein
MVTPLLQDQGGKKMTTQAQFNLENYLTKNKLDKCKTNKKIT